MTLLNVKSAVGDDAKAFVVDVLVVGVAPVISSAFVELADGVRVEVRSGAVGLRGLVAGETRGDRSLGMITTSGSSAIDVGFGSSVELVLSSVVDLVGEVGPPNRVGGCGDVGEGIVKVAETAVVESSLVSLVERRSPSLGRIEVRLVGVGGALIV